MEKRIVITGLGMIGDFGIGREDFLNFIEGRKQKQKITDFNIDDYIDTGLLRRADQVSYFASVAAKLALESAELLVTTGVEEKYRVGTIVATVHGALEYTIEYHKELVLNGPTMVSPSLFSNSVINSAVSSISNIFKIRGFTETIPGYTGVHQSIKLASELIAEDQLDICLVGGVDINNEFLVDAYSSCIEDSKLISQSFGGSGFLVIESLGSALERGSKVYAEILGVEILTAEYQKLIQFKISPARQFKLEDIGCVLSSAFYDRDSKARERAFLEDLDRNKVAIFSCRNLFGCTFCAAESFQIILGVIKTENLFNKVLNSYSSQSGSNAYLLLGRYVY
jgi:hypothetical protein